MTHEQQVFASYRSNGQLANTGVDHSLRTCRGVRVLEDLPTQIPRHEALKKAGAGFFAAAMALLFEDAAASTPTTKAARQLPNVGDATPIGLNLTGKLPTAAQITKRDIGGLPIVGASVIRIFESENHLQGLTPPPELVFYIEAPEICGHAGKKNPVQPVYPDYVFVAVWLGATAPTLNPICPVPPNT